MQANVEVDEPSAPIFEARRWIRADWIAHNILSRLDQLTSDTGRPAIDFARPWATITPTPEKPADLAREFGRQSGAGHSVGGLSPLGRVRLAHGNGLVTQLLLRRGRKALNSRDMGIRNRDGRVAWSGMRRPSTCSTDGKRDQHPRDHCPTRPRTSCTCPGASDDAGNLAPSCAQRDPDPVGRARGAHRRLPAGAHATRWYAYVMRRGMPLAPGPSTHAVTRSALTRS